MKNALLGLVLGSLGGVAYKYGGDSLYSTSREAWLISRAKTIQTSTFRTPSRSRPKFIPYAEAKNMNAKRLEEVNCKESDSVADINEKKE